MPRLIDKPTRIQAAGNKPKTIEEYVGRVNSGHVNASVARMVSPEGWREPGQRRVPRAVRRDQTGPFTIAPLATSWLWFGRSSKRSLPDRHARQAVRRRQSP